MVKTVKMVKFLVAFTFMVLITLLVTTFVASAASYTAVTTANVNLRSYGGTDYKVITVVPKGTTITVNEDMNLNDAWFSVKLSTGEEGFMHSYYIKENNLADTSYGGGVYNATTTSTVNLRAWKSTNSAIQAVVPKGAAIDVLDSSDGTWYFVRLSNGQEGYMHKAYITPGSLTSTTPTPSSTTKTTATVNLRAWMGTEYKVIKVVPANTAVTVLDSTNATWWNVKLPTGEIGWMHTNYISGVGGSTIAPVPTPSTGVYTSTSVNLRAWKGTNYNIIKVASAGTKVMVLDNSLNDSTWVNVQLPTGEVGWMHVAYLKGYTSSAGSTWQPEAPSLGNNMTTTTVNLRAWKGTNYKVITVASAGTKVTVLDSSDPNWWNVKLPTGEIGWIYNSYISK